MNNADRRRAKERREMKPVLYVRTPRLDGRHNVIPLRFLVDDERAEYLRRATSPL